MYAVLSSAMVMDFFAVFLRPLKATETFAVLLPGDLVRERTSREVATLLCLRSLVPIG